MVGKLSGNEENKASCSSVSMTGAALGLVLACKGTLGMGTANVDWARGDEGAERETKATGIAFFLMVTTLPEVDKVIFSLLAVDTDT